MSPIILLNTHTCIYIYIIQNGSKIHFHLVDFHYRIDRKSQGIGLYSITVDRGLYY